MAVVAEAGPLEVRSAALQVLAGFDRAEVAARLLKLHQTAAPPQLQTEIRDVLLSRVDSARHWLTAVDRGEIPAAVTPLEQVRRVALLEDPELDALVSKHWGKLEAATDEELLAEVRRLNNDLRAASGDANAGRAVFKQHCAVCHQLFGEGASLGPDLTSANRHDRNFMLISLVDPSSVIRRGYISLIVQTRDGRVLTGIGATRDDATLALRDAKNHPIVVPTAEIESVRESPISLMPADLYRLLTPQELRDLFAYLESGSQR